MANFKISLCGVDQPQELELLYDEFKENEKYPGTYTTKVIHNGEEKWWNLSEYVASAIKKLGAKSGDIITATRREREGGKTFTEIGIPGDITTQKQNVATPTVQKNKVIQKELTREQELQERIMRAQMINVSTSILQTEDQQKIVTLAEALRTGEVGEYIKTGLKTSPAQSSEASEPLPEPQGEKIDVNSLPW